MAVPVEIAGNDGIRNWAEDPENSDLDIWRELKRTRAITLRCRGEFQGKMGG